MVRRRIAHGMGVSLNDLFTTALTDLNAPISWAETGLYNSFYGPTSPAEAQAENSTLFQNCLKAAGSDTALVQACYQQGVKELNAVNTEAAQGTPEGYVADWTGSGINAPASGASPSTTLEVVVILAALGVGIFLLKR